MPTYEYVCDACGAEHEVFQSIKDDPLKKCPACKKSKLRRKLGVGGGFIFKGSGFYITDYRSDSYKDAAKKESGGDAKPAATDGAAAKPRDGAAGATGEAKKPAAAAKTGESAKPKRAGPKKA